MKRRKQVKKKRDQNKVNSCVKALWYGTVYLIICDSGSDRTFVVSMVNYFF